MPAETFLGHFSAARASSTAAGTGSGPVTYNAALKRYLWWQQIPKRPYADTRFDGGFGVYDAPEPWGPWTCVCYTECWDVGPGKTGSFPVKWMSADGRTIHLAFSGDDCLAVRRAALIVGPLPLQGPV